MEDLTSLEEKVEAFRKGNLELWCPKITIYKKAGAEGITYSGCGLIRQDNDQRLEFVLIDYSSSSSLSWKNMLGNHREAGKLLPAEEYYTLEAIDLSGLTWTAERLLISQSFSQSGSITRGNIYVLEHKESSDSKNATIMFQIFEDVRLPFAIRQKEDSILETGNLSPYPREGVIFKIHNYDLKIIRENNILIIRADAKDENIPEHFETRIIEALQYITSHTLSWRILQKNGNKNRLTLLRSPDKPVRPAELSLPIDYIHDDFAGEWTWKLFGKYLEHIDHFVGENRFQMHPLSAWLNYARNASTGSIFGKGLGLGIAVEGVLENEYPNIGEPAPEDSLALEEMITHVKFFSGSTKALRRTLGAIEAMRKGRPKDKLISLLEKGVVRASDVKAWDEIRNRGAHARPPEKAEMQEWIDNCYKTEVLLNHLIFHTIGYEGEFTDYGALNWPPSKYPLKTENPS